MFCGRASGPVRRPVANLLVALVVSFLVTACDSTRLALLTDVRGDGVAETAVRLIIIDDKGIEQSQIAARVTDDKGRFNFPIDVANASVVVEAELAFGTVRGFWAGKGDSIPVNPLASGLVSVLVDITRTPEGRSVTDFSSEELRNIADQLFTADVSDVLLTDSESVKQFVRDSVGREIAVASGGAISGESTALFVGSPTTSTATFAADTSVCHNGALLHLLESGSFQFGVERDGSICGGTSSTLSDILHDDSLLLYFPGNDFFVGGKSFPSGGTAELTDSRELTLSTYRLTDPDVIFPNSPEEGDVAVRRKIYVPATGDYARFVETFENTGSETETISVEVQSFLETGSESALLTYDRTPSDISASDRFFAAYDVDQDRPTVGFVVQDGLISTSVSELDVPGLAGGQANEVTYRWTNIAIPAGKTRTLLHFFFLSSSRSATTIYDSLEAIARSPEMSGLSLEELAGLINFVPAIGTILGEAGSATGGSEVTGTNPRTSEAVSVTARLDGSFGIPIDTQSGDSIAIVGEDGLSLTIEIE